MRSPLLTVAVIAKEPRPGSVKTRLCPPCTPSEAAAVASALLADVADAVSALPGRRVLLHDGPATAWAPAGFAPVQQRRGGLDERLELAFHDLGGPALIVAADAVVGADDVIALAEPLATGATDAALGPALDGGYWAIGLLRPVAGCVRGVPMQQPHTFAAQLARLHRLGLRTFVGPRRPDVDTPADLAGACAARPCSAVARCVDKLGLRERLLREGEAA